MYVICDRCAALRFTSEGAPRAQLRPLWRLFSNVLLEVQPRAWAAHNISREVSLATFADLMAANRFRAVYLPHAAAGERPSKLRFDPCALQPYPATWNYRLPRGLTNNATVLSATRFVALLRYAAYSPLRSPTSWSDPFQEFWLTAEECT